MRNLFEKATNTDSTGRSFDYIDTSGNESLRAMRTAQRAVIAIEQRDETNRLLAEQNDLLRQLLARG